MIQFPLYAGIMGIMMNSGLVDVISELFVQVSNSTTLPISVVSNRNKYSNILEDINNSQDPYLKAKIFYTENRFNTISSDKIIEQEKQNEQDEFEKLLD